MRFDLDDVIPGHNRFQDFGAFLDPGCEKGNGILGGSALGPHPREATRRIEAGKRMYIRTAWINHADAGPDQVAVTRCVNLLSFVPEAGRRYELDQLITSDTRLGALATVACAARLIDGETGKAPGTLREHPSAGRCSYIYL